VDRHPSPKRILLWTPNYAPDMTGIPPLVTDAAEWLHQRGHAVRVVTTVPHYPQRQVDPTYSGRLWCSEARNGIQVDRSWLFVRREEGLREKLLYEMTASGLSLPTVLRAVTHADVLVCLIPTLSAAFYASWLRRIRPRLRLVLWFQDLVLRVAESVTEVPRPARPLFAIAAAAEAYASRRADTVVVCSPGFSDYLAALGTDVDHVETILNWVDVSRIRPAPPPPGPCTRFLYAGNLGYTQGFETLIEAAGYVGPDVVVEVVGDGNAQGQVESLAGSVSNVSVAPPVPASEYPALLARADVHLVLQRRVAAGANLPSKIASAMASGRPVLASIDRRTPAASLLRRSGGAVLVEPESPRRLADAMRQLAADPALRAELGVRARAFAVRELDRERALPRLEAAIVGQGDGPG
jgi:colanic acid biosynthesis glycosyl transferase WcaI